MSNPKSSPPGKLRALLLGLLVLFVGSGCGSSEQFVFTRPLVVNTGALEFNLATLAPAGTTTVDLDFFSEDNALGDLLLEATVDFENPFTIGNIPANAQSAVVTFRNGDGTATRVVIVNFEVQPGETTVVTLNNIRSLEITPDSATLPAGGFPTTFTGQANLNGAITPASDANVDSDADNDALVTTAGLTVTSNNASQFGSTLVFFTFDDGNPATIDPMDSAVVNVVDETVDSFTIDPSPLTGANQLFVSERRDITATGTLTGGSTVNLPLSGLTLASSPQAILDMNQLVALLEGTDTLTFTYSGPAANPTNPEAMVDVSVRRVQLTSAQVTLGGIAQGETGFGSVPDGFAAVLEVTGTFEDGSSRVLAGGVTDGVPFDGNDYGVMVTGDFARVAFGSFRTNEVINDTDVIGDTGTATITFNTDRDGGLAPIVVNLTNIDPAGATSASATFTNYDDEDRFLLDVPGLDPSREVDFRVNFGNAPNFRLAFPNVTGVVGGVVDLAQSIGGWPMLNHDTDLNNTDVVFNTTGPNITLTGVTTVEPTLVTIEPATDVDLAPGQSASFSSMVNYGAGPLNRTADYPVFEEFNDFIAEVYVTLDEPNGLVNFFLKLDPGLLNVNLRDLTGQTITNIGGDDVVQISAP